MKKIMVAALAVCIASSVAAQKAQVDTRTKWEKQHLTSEKWKMLQERTLESKRRHERTLPKRQR